MVASSALLVGTHVGHGEIQKPEQRLLTLIVEAFDQGTIYDLCSKRSSTGAGSGGGAASGKCETGASDSSTGGLDVLTPSEEVMIIS